MHALIINGVVEKYPYSVIDLRNDNPNVSFPREPTDELLQEYNVQRIERVEQPDYDPITQNMREDVPQEIGGTWTQVWLVGNASEQEVAQRKAAELANLQMLRAAAYRDEADPLYFKAQRNEGAIDDWYAKVEEIRARYPYPE